MTKLTILLSTFLLCTITTQATINPIFKECMQRGYEVTTEGDIDYCTFPDGSKCLLEDFNEQRCGQEFFNKEYCIEEGIYVWDTEKCCKGLVAYLPRDMVGQARCEKATKLHLNNFKNSKWPFGILLAALLGLAMFLYVRYKRKNKDT